MQTTSGVSNTLRARNYRHALRAALVALAAVAPLGPSAHAADPVPAATPALVVRPEIGKILQAAQEAIAAKNYAAALVKLDEADAIPATTPDEALFVTRLRGAAALLSGNQEGAARAFRAAIDSGLLKPEEVQQIELAMAQSYYESNDFANSIVWCERHVRDGGTSRQATLMLAQSYYSTGQFANAARLLQGIVQSAEKVGEKPAENQLTLLANAYLKAKDDAGLLAALETLVRDYPSRDHWADLMSRVQRKPGFPDRLTLDAYRLQYDAGALTDAEDLVEMAALALQAGFPTEAKKALDDGYRSGLLGTGANAPRDRKLRDTATKDLGDDQKSIAKDEQTASTSKDSGVVVNLGYNFALIGQPEKGIAMIERGLSLPGLKDPNQARLKLGMACLYAGDKEKAIAAFRSVDATDPSADLARLWVLRVRQT